MTEVRHLFVSFNSGGVQSVQTGQWAPSSTGRSLRRCRRRSGTRLHICRPASFWECRDSTGRCETSISEDDRGPPVTRSTVHPPPCHITASRSTQRLVLAFVLQPISDFRPFLCAMKILSCWRCSLSLILKHIPFTVALMLWLPCKWNGLVCPPNSSL